MNVPATHRHCPVGHATALLGDRWSMLIIREALAGVDRYQGFRDELNISDHTLSRRLTYLTEIGLLQRGDSAQPRYHLTEAGRDLARVLATLGDWAMRWLPVDLPLKQPSTAVLLAADELGFETPSHSPTPRDGR
ncbi:MAG: winged helix-turn-helix transcriptional regulator [Acidimicrobiales bacterium]